MLQWRKRIQAFRVSLSVFLVLDSTFGLGFSFVVVLEAHQLLCICSVFGPSILYVKCVGNKNLPYGFLAKIISKNCIYPHLSS